MRTVDRRIQKTQQALHDALISLMREKRYDDILVQEILDRANVGRSTFYMHYRDKDELLLSGIDHLSEFLQAAQAEVSANTKNRYDKVIGFSFAMFDHAYDHRDVYRSLVHGIGWTIVRQKMEAMIAELVQKEVKPYYNKLKSPDMPLELFVLYIVSVFFSLLTWWIDKRKDFSPQEIDNCFRELIIPALKLRMRD